MKNDARSAEITELRRLIWVVTNETLICIPAHSTHYRHDTFIRSYFKQFDNPHWKTTFSYVTVNVLIAKKVVFVSLLLSQNWKNGLLLYLLLKYIYLTPLNAHPDPLIFHPLHHQPLCVSMLSSFVKCFTHTQMIDFDMLFIFSLVGAQVNPYLNKEYFIISFQ